MPALSAFLPTKRDSFVSSSRSAPIVPATLLIILSVLGFAPYVGVDFGSAAAQRWLAEAAPDSVRATVDYVNIIAGFAVWDVLAALTALAAWWLGARAFAWALLQGLSIEIVALIAKAVFLAPWILAHAMPIGGYVVARAAPATVQNGASPALRFAVDVPVAGDYGARVRLSGDRWGMNSVSLGLDGAPQSSAKGLFVLPDGWWRWGSTGSDGADAFLEIASPGRHIVNVWPRAAGVRLDRLELRLETSSSSGAGTWSGEEQGSPASAIGMPPIVVDAESFDTGLQPDASTWIRRTGLPDRFPSRLLFTIRTADVPSAHVARVLTMLGLAAGCAPRARRRLRIGLATGTILAVAAVACARILSNAHTPIGSVAGGVLGLMWLQWLMQRHPWPSAANDDRRRGQEPPTAPSRRETTNQPI